MIATLSDRIYLEDMHDENAHIKQTLTFPNPKYNEALSFGRSTRDIPQTIELFEQLLEDIAIPRGIALDKLGIDSVEDKRKCHPVQFTTSISLRDYQARAVKLAFDAGGGVIVAPTGSGKTTMSIELASILGERCLILVKSLDLAKQWQAAIKQFTGRDAGLICGGKWEEGREFTIGLVQTLVKHWGSLDYGLVIVDEAHNIPAQQAYNVINQQKAKYRYGLSATPQRRDNLEFMIHAVLGPIVAEIESHEVNGAVLPVTVSTVHHNFIGNPESWTDFINLLSLDEERNRVIVSRAIKSSRVVGTAVLTATVSHAEALTALVNQHGVDALLLHGQLPKKVREQRMRDAPDSRLIIGTLQLLSEGIDWPHVGAIIFAAPVSASVDDRVTPAATRLIQSIGRARRPYPGKLRAHILDIIDNHPLGKSAYRKRAEIYRLQGFLTRETRELY